MVLVYLVQGLAIFCPNSTHQTTIVKGIAQELVNIQMRNQELYWGKDGKGHLWEKVHQLLQYKKV